MGVSSCYCAQSGKFKLIEEDFFSDPHSESYDMILNFYSFKQLKEGGYRCYFTEDGHRKYQNSKNENNIVIGILGMKNRGKSYLLGRIMSSKDYKSPDGFLVTTYGISCNFPQLESKNTFFITLDTAGRDSPLLKNMIYNDNIKDFVNDQAITEIVLSDFIIQESNILIAVLEQLTFEEQRMLNTLIERLKKKDIKGIQKRRLLVIHNLMNLNTIEGIESFKKEILFKSLTFKLIKQSMRKILDYDDSGRYVYIQVIDKENENQNKLEIIHLIFGNDNVREIQKEYNEPALRFIRDYITINTTRKFDIVERFPDFLIRNSKKYLTGKELGKDSIQIKKERTQVTNDKKKTVIPLESKHLEFDVKAFVKDIGGNEIFYNKINPRYSTRLIKKNNNKYYLEIIFELYGKVKKLRSKIVPDEDKDQYIIVISGENEEIEKSGEHWVGNLEYTEFDFQMTIKKFITDETNQKEIELVILKHEEKDIKFEMNEQGLYKLYLDANIYEIEV